MTEDEAKTKSCPFAKYFGASQQVAEGPGPHCIGSECMAWRSGNDEISEIEEITLSIGELPVGERTPNYPKKTEYEKEYWSQSPSVSSGFNKWRKYVVHKSGYCGLAGKPL